MVFYTKAHLHLRISGFFRYFSHINVRREEMINRYEQNNYYSHDLSIAMQTSSGDRITMDFANHKSSSLSYSKDSKGESASMQFSSMQSFQFLIESNGIDAQDQKEIDAFMKKAKPFIDKFLKELNEDAPGTPVTQIAKQIAAAFEPNAQNSQEKDKHIKTNIVKAFDEAFKQLPPPKEDINTKSLEEIFKDAQKLLEKTLKEFDDFNKKIYV